MGQLLEGNRAIVVGGASGIGLDTATLFLELGANVGVLDKNEVALMSALESLRQDGRRPEGQCVDATDQAGLRRGMGSLAGRLGGLDSVVISVGVHELLALPEITEQAFQRMVGTNAWSALNTISAAVTLLPRGGSIVALSSLSGVRGHPLVRGIGAAHYAASKGAVASLAKSAALELAHRGVRVNAVAPSMIITPMTRDSYTSSELGAYASRVPLGRLGEARDVSGVIAFLCSSLSRYVTGEVITVSGGVALV